MPIEELKISLQLKFGLPEVRDVRYYNCKNWGWNRGKVMNDLGYRTNSHIVKIYAIEREDELP